MDLKRPLGNVVLRSLVDKNNGFLSARALIKEPKVLIFDDCLSAVDTKTEETILRSLSRIMKGKTCIFIAHRISTIKNADHILVMDQGEIVEQGTHAELMEKRGEYFELHEKQLLESVEG
jgi:ABC-type bacteriocin/lantibiotic exporters, contain an N-terminal double-glycine peptidase domain